MIKIKFEHDEGKHLNTSNLFVDANGKVSELTDSGNLVARNDVGFSMYWDKRSPSQEVSPSGTNRYQW